MADSDALRNQIAEALYALPVEPEELDEVMEVVQKAINEAKRQAWEHGYSDGYMVDPPTPNPYAAGEHDTPADECNGAEHWTGLPACGCSFHNPPAQNPVTPMAVGADGRHPFVPGPVDASICDEPTCPAADDSEHPVHTQPAQQPTSSDAKSEVRGRDETGWPQHQRTRRMRGRKLVELCLCGQSWPCPDATPSPNERCPEMHPERSVQCAHKAGHFRITHEGYDESRGVLTWRTPPPVVQQQQPVVPDTAQVRAWHTQDPHDLGGRCIRRDCDRGPWPCDVVRLCDALDEARAEIMAHQVGDGYEKGYEHGSLTALKFKERAEKAEAEVRELRTEVESRSHYHNSDLQGLIDALKARDAEIRNLTMRAEKAEAAVTQAWDEGFAAGVEYGCTGQRTGEWMDEPENPYRVRFLILIDERAALDSET